MGNSPMAGGRAPVRLFASAGSWIEGRALEQLDQVAAFPGAVAVAGMPDLHPGKYGPVGCSFLADRLYPLFVGSDIGCGMGLFRLDIPLRKLRLEKLAERLGVLDDLWEGDAASALAEAGIEPTGLDSGLGTIGGGNHFCEFQAVEEIAEPEAASRAGLDPGSVYILTHSGSRALGYSILQRQMETGGGALAIASEAGQSYLGEHDRAVRWAALNRRIIAARAAEIARAETQTVADLSHNLLELRPSGANPATVLHRKGAAPSDRGLVPIPGSRGTLSYLVEPLGDADPEALGSLAHGAGRKYNRGAMHGRAGTNKSELVKLARNPFGGLVVCEDRDLLIEEAPDAYKNIGQVIGDLAAFGLARVVASFRPLLTFKTGVSRAADIRAERGADRRSGKR
jgi:release factor H-coupled RctB family protein